MEKVAGAIMSFLADERGLETVGYAIIASIPRMVAAIITSTKV